MVALTHDSLWIEMLRTVCRQLCNRARLDFIDIVEINETCRLFT